jgi:hypothetical protein
MENTEAQDLVGTDFHALRAALTVPEKTFLGNKGADNKVIPLFQNKFSNKRDQKIDEKIPPEIVAKLHEKHPVGERSQKLWGVICSLVECGFTDEQVTGIILPCPIGEKAREKPNPEEWLKPQIQKAREEFNRKSSINCNYSAKKMHSMSFFT